MISCNQIFAAEALLRSVHEMAERLALNANAPELPLIHAVLAFDPLHVAVAPVVRPDGQAAAAWNVSQPLRVPARLPATHQSGLF